MARARGEWFGPAAALQSKSPRNAPSSRSPMPFEPQLFAVMAIVFLSTLTRSAFGFGNAMIAMPLLSLVVPVETAAPLVALVSTIIAAVSIAQDWQDIHFPSAGRLVAAS